LLSAKRLGAAASVFDFFSSVFVFNVVFSAVLAVDFAVDSASNFF